MTEGKVYAVSSGSYSDYIVYCIFEQRDDAIAYAAKLNNLNVDDQRYLEDEAWCGGEKAQAEQNTERYRKLTRNLSFPRFASVEPFDFYPAGVVPVGNN